MRDKNDPDVGIRYVPFKPSPEGREGGTDPTLALPTPSSSSSSSSSDGGGGGGQPDESPRAGIPRELLWLPYVVIAVVFLLFLGLNFFLYHRRNRVRLRRKREALLLKTGLFHRRHILATARSHFSQSLTDLPGGQHQQLRQQQAEDAGGGGAPEWGGGGVGGGGGSRPCRLPLLRVQDGDEEEEENYVTAQASLSHGQLGRGACHSSPRSTSEEDEPYAEPDLAGASQLAEADGPETTSSSAAGRGDQRKMHTLPARALSKSLLYQRKVLLGEATLNDIRLEVGRRRRSSSSTSVLERSRDSRDGGGGGALASPPVSQSADASPRPRPAHQGAPPQHRKYAHPLFGSTSRPWAPGGSGSNSNNARCSSSCSSSQDVADDAGAGGNALCSPGEDGDPTDWTFFSRERVHGFALDWGNSPTLTRSVKGQKQAGKGQGLGQGQGGEEKVKLRESTPEEAQRRQREEELPFMDEEAGP